MTESDVPVFQDSTEPVRKIEYGSAHVLSDDTDLFKGDAASPACSESLEERLLRREPGGKVTGAIPLDPSATSWSVKTLCRKRFPYLSINPDILGMETTSIPVPCIIQTTCRRVAVE